MRTDSPAPIIVGRQVLHHADCPVLIARPQA
jgi:hypothetical protein